ncbi:MAG TPA: sortase [Streptosporangiaceae bacterium]
MLEVAAVPRRRRPALPGWAFGFVWTLTALAGVAAWFLFYGISLSGFQESSAQHALYARLRTEIAQAIAPLGGNIKLGSPVAVLRVPQAGIDVVVVEGTTPGLLENGPGLQSDTPLPGQAGVSVIMGRQTLFGGPFRHLNALQRGDLIDVTTGQGTFGFRVLDLRYPGDPLPPPLKPGGSRLVLVTTAGTGWHGLGAPNQVLYVDTALIGKPVASPAGMPTITRASEQPMHGDPGVLFVLVMWLQLLVVTVLAVIWVRSRWGRWQTWLAGAPAILAVLWIVSETAFQLLPNLI